MIFKAYLNGYSLPYLEKEGSKEELEIEIEKEHLKLKNEGWNLVYFSKYPEIANSQVWLFLRGGRKIMTRLKGF